MGRIAIQDQKSSLSFNGSTSYASFSGVRHTSGIFSLGFWVKPYKPMFYQRLVSCRGYTTNGGFEMEYVGVNDSFHSIFTNSSDGLIGTTGSIYINRGSWNYVSMTVENSTVKTYVNAELKHTLTLSGTIGSAASQNLTLGRKSYDPSMYALMNMSQFSFENGAVWTVEQIRRRMAQLPSSGTVVAKLDEGAGTVAYDSSGNNNNGTITNGTWVSDTPTKKRKAVGGNLVFNGDFSYTPPAAANVATTTSSRFADGTAGGSTTNNLFGWGILISAGTGGLLLDTSVTRNGKNSLKISALDTSANITVSPFLNVVSPTAAQAIPLLPSTSYTWSGWVKTSNVGANGAFIDLREYTGAMATVATTSTSKLSGTNDWTYLTATVTTGATTRYGAIVLRNVVAGTVSDAWYNDITLTPTTPDTRLAVVDMKSSLQNSTGYLTVPVQLSNTSFNVAFWYKRTSIPALDKTPFSTLSGGNGLLLQHDGASSGKNFYLTAVNGGAYTYGMGFGNSPVAGEWTHIAFTGASNVIKGYRDGKLLFSTSATLPTNFATTYFGSVTSGVNNTPALYKDIVIENGTRWTDDQVLKMSKCIATPSTATAYLKLDEGAGTTAYDSSGNGNNGTITAGTYVLDTPTKKRKVVGGNLVYNGDFSYVPPFTAATAAVGKWIDGTASGNSLTEKIFGWSTNAPYGTYSAQYDTSVSRNGIASLKLTIGANSFVGVGGALSQSATNVKLFAIPVLPSTSYTVSGFIKTAWVSGSATRGAYIRVEQFDGAGASITSVDTGYFNTTVDWTPITTNAVFTTGATCRFIVVQCAAHSTSGATTLNGTAWFDDIQLRPTTPTTRTAA